MGTIELGIFFGLLFSIVFIFGWCIYQVGYGAYHLSRWSVKQVGRLGNKLWSYINR